MSNIPATAPEAFGRIKFDPESGQFCLWVGATIETQRWSAPMSMEQLSRLLKDEYHRRVRDGQQQTFYAESIPLASLLAAGVGNATPKVIDASHPEIKKAAAKKIHDKVRFMDASELLQELDF